MIYLDLPTINGTGTTERQLSEIRSYIYRNNEQINAALSNLTVDKIWEQTASALSASNGDNDEKSDILSQYQKIRDLVIKTADVIIQTDEQWQMAMSGSYLAKSQFGEYLLNTSVEIDGNSTGFTQLYTYSTELRSDYDNYTSYQKNFIKEGLLDDSGDLPIYGIDVGLLTNEFTVTKEDGTTETVSVDSNKKLRITPTRLSLYDDNTEVAYIQENAIYFPKANIRGGSIYIGNGNFMVDSVGNLTAKSGYYSGEIAVSSITTSLNEWSNHIELSGGYIYTYQGENDDKVKTSRIGDKGQTFYNDAGVEMGKFCVTKYDDRLLGVGTVLEHGTGTFITIAGHYDSIDAKTYNPDVVWSRGDTSEIQHNIYPEMGLHIATPCYYHNSDVSGMNITNIYSDSYPTTTGKILVSCKDSKGSEFWAELQVRNGLITSLYTEDL